MTEYTAHVQVPDAAIGSTLHGVVLGHPDVTSCTLRSDNGTWLSFGFRSETEHGAVMLVSTIRYHSSRVTDFDVPRGYERDSLLSFETAPMIVTCGPVVVHSEGI